MTIDPIGEELVAHPGASYLTYLADLVHSRSAKTYFEVGTNFGSSLAPINCPSIAVDPTFRLTMEVVGKKPLCLMYQHTSDDFFAKYDPTSLLGGPLDVAFLDGMHLYEFLLRDIINTEKHCHKNSMIILHDCVPPTFEMTNRQCKPAMLHPNYRNYWTGDVWKVMPIIKAYRPDLKITYIDCPPTGLVVLSNCDPKSTALADNYDRAVQEWLETPNDLARLKEFLKTVSLVRSHDVTANALQAALVV